MKRISKFYQNEIIINLVLVKKSTNISFSGMTSHYVIGGWVMVSNTTYLIGQSIINICDMKNMLAGGTKNSPLDST